MAKTKHFLLTFFTFHLANITHFPMTQLRITTPFFHWPYYSQYIKYYRFPNYPPYTDQALLLTLLLSTYQILQISQWPTIHRPSTFVDITTLHISNITDFPIRLCKHQLVIYRSPLVNIIISNWLMHQFSLFICTDIWLNWYHQPNLY